MPYATLDGISSYYEITGSGPALLMFSPGGFDAKLANWASHGSWKQMRLVDDLSARYTCITFDRREAGRSSGRVERIGWGSYLTQALALLDTLGIARAHLMGGCVGCTLALGLAVARPERVLSLMLYFPAGGPRYRITQSERFAKHLNFVSERGLDGLSNLLSASPATFGTDPRVGPWCGLLRAEPEWMDTLRERGAQHYLRTVETVGRGLFDRDTVPGLEAEDMLQVAMPTLIVPGYDDSHAPSAAQFLHECLPNTELWSDRGVEPSAPAKILEFLQAADRAREHGGS